MCSSADPQDNSHVVQQEVAAEDGPSPHEVWKNEEQEQNQRRDFVTSLAPWTQNWPPNSANA